MPTFLQPIALHDHYNGVEPILNPGRPTPLRQRCEVLGRRRRYRTTAARVTTAITVRKIGRR